MLIDFTYWLIEFFRVFHKILYHLSKIPYPDTVAIDKSGKSGVAIEFPSSEIREFLDAFYLLKPLLDSYFIQQWSRIPEINIGEGFNFFDKESNSFVKLDKEYERIVRLLGE
ncbi:MAG: hypothetical protein HGN29_08330 [Asgard group archaeon]|nr:hypothetical protein [Asgard group archaeon]